MNFRSKIRRQIVFVVCYCFYLPAVASAHLPIPPKQPGEVGRRIIKKAVADFTLVDQNGIPFRFTSKRGNLVLATFIFTSCPDVCPLLSAKFAAIQRTLKTQKFKDYWLLSISTDPERDDAASLKEYGRRFNADFSRWAFLTGTREDLTKAWKTFGVNVTKNDSGQVFHTALSTLMDRQGYRRVDYYGDKWLDKEVLQDIHWLSSQK
jgi:protein SCO1